MNLAISYPLFHISISINLQQNSLIFSSVP